MTIYIRMRDDGPPLWTITSPKEEGKVGHILSAFSRLSGYFKLDKSSFEITFLLPEEMYSQYSSIVSSSRGILATRTKPEYAKNYLNSLDMMEDPYDIFNVLRMVDEDKRFEFPDVKVSPLLSYEFLPGKTRIKLHKKWVKDIDKENLIEYFEPAISASSSLYSGYGLPVVCRAGEETTNVLIAGHNPGAIVQTHSDYYNVLFYDGDTPKGCVYYEDNKGKRLENVVRSRKRL